MRRRLAASIAINISPVLHLEDDASSVVGFLRCRKYIVLVYGSGCDEPQPEPYTRTPLAVCCRHGEIQSISTGPVSHSKNPSSDMPVGRSQTPHYCPWFVGRGFSMNSDYSIRSALVYSMRFLPTAVFRSSPNCVQRLPHRGHQLPSFATFCFGLYIYIYIYRTDRIVQNVTSLKGD